MRILELSELYPPALGGTERHTQNLSRALAARGHDVAVLTLTAGGTSEGTVIEPDGLEVTRVRSSFQKLWSARFADDAKPYHPPAPDPAVTSAVRAAVRRLRPDVIHTHNWILYSALAARTGVPVVHTVHDFSAVCARRDLLLDGAACAGPSRSCLGCSKRTYGLAGPVALAALGATRLANRSVTELVAVSEEHAEASAAAFPGVPCSVIASFVGDDTERLCTNPVRPDFVGEGDYLFFVGALSATKGLDVLLAAYERLRGTLGTDCPRLVLAGTRRADTPELDLPGVSAALDVDHPLVCAAHHHALATVIPSRVAESFGQVAVEAGLAGTPAVVAAHGGLARIVVDGVTGLHTAPGDPNALHAALVRVCTEPGLAERLGAAAPAQVAHLTAGGTAPLVEEVLMRAVANAPAPRTGTE